MEQIHVVDQEDLKRDREATLAGVFQFLGVDPSFRDTRFSREQNRSADKFRLTPLGERILASCQKLFLKRLHSGYQHWFRQLFLRPFAARKPDFTISPGDRSEIGRRFSADSREFEHLTGRDFPQWSSLFESNPQNNTAP